MDNDHHQPPILIDDLPERVRDLAELLGQLLTGQSTVNSIQQKLKTMPDVAELIRLLAGKTIAKEDVIVQFGEGAQLGDVTVRDIAAGNIYTININFAPTKHPLSQDPTSAALDVLKGYIKCVLRLEPGFTFSNSTWLLVFLGILLAPFTGATLWQGICRFLGWSYYLGGTGNEPHGLHAFIWGATTNGPIILFALIGALPYSLPSLGSLKVWFLVILTYTSFNGMAGVVFYDSGIRSAVERYDFGYALQELIIILTWSAIIAVASALSLLVTYRVSKSLIHLGSVTGLIVLPILFCMAAFIAFFLLFPPESTSDWVRGIFAGLFLRLGLFMGLTIMFMMNACIARMRIDK